MPWSSEHTKWLVNTGSIVTISDGKQVQVWEFQHCDDDEILSAWAAHFRNHYCLDERIDEDRRAMGLSRSEYLNNVLFPDPAEGFGPRVRSGDFGEILVSDFFQYLMDFWVPRTRYADKANRNESTKGSDVLGFKFVERGDENPKDTLIVIEAKAQLTGRSSSTKVQEAVDHSIKDQIRKAISLNAAKNKLRYFFNNEDEALLIERFQNPVDKPYSEQTGAVAILNDSVFDPATISKTDCTKHPARDNLILIVIHGKDMMPLVHELYRRAADEA